MSYFGISLYIRIISSLVTPWLFLFPSDVDLFLFYLRHHISFMRIRLRSLLVTEYSCFAVLQPSVSLSCLCFVLRSNCLPVPVFVYVFWYYSHVSLRVFTLRSRVVTGSCVPSGVSLCTITSSFVLSSIRSIETVIYHEYQLHVWECPIRGQFPPLLPFLVSSMIAQGYCKVNSNKTFIYL